MVEFSNSELRKKTHSQVGRKFSFLVLAVILVTVSSMISGWIGMFLDGMIFGFRNTAIVAVGMRTPFLLFSVLLPFLFITPIIYGWYKTYLKIAREETPEVSDLWSTFSIYGKVLWTDILSSIFIFLWSLLFIIPGIIKAFSYVMAPFILLDNNGLMGREAITRSKNMMKGKKGKFFAGWLFYNIWPFLIILAGFIAWSLYTGQKLAEIAASYNIYNAADLLRYQTAINIYFNSLFTQPAFILWTSIWCIIMIVVSLLCKIFTTTYTVNFYEKIKEE